jgi:uncharacterized protein YggU (UPF0235/DUF167 family)
LTGWWRAEGEGVAVRVKVQPRARRAGLGGVVPGPGGPAGDGPRLRVAVTEAPEDGKATRAACIALAEALGVAPSAVQLLHGAAAREKTLQVAGDPAALGARLESLA